MTSTSEPPTVEQKPHLEAGNAGGLVAEALEKPDGKPGGYTATMDIDQINDEKSKAGEKVGVDVKKAGSDDGALNSTKVDEKTKEDGGMEKEKQKKEDGNEDDKEPQDPKTMPVREYLETTGRWNGVIVVGKRVQHNIMCFLHPVPRFILQVASMLMLCLSSTISRYT